MLPLPRRLTLHNFLQQIGFVLWHFSAGTDCSASSSSSLDCSTWKSTTRAAAAAAAASAGSNRLLMRFVNHRVSTISAGAGGGWLLVRLLLLTSRVNDRSFSSDSVSAFTASDAELGSLVRARSFGLVCQATIASASDSASASQSDLAAFSQRHWALSGTTSSTSFVSLFNFKLVFLLSASSLTDRAGNYLLPSTYAPSPLRRLLRLRRLCIVHYQMDDDSRSHCGHHCPPLVMSFNSILTALWLTVCA